MAQNGFSDGSGVKRDAGTSRKRRDPAEGPYCATEGRALLRRGIVAHLYRCPTSLCGVRLAAGTRRVPVHRYIQSGCKQPGGQNHPGQTILSGPEML